MRRLYSRVGLIVLLLVLFDSSARADDKVNVKVVKYGDLAETIKQAKGKVVVVDFWAWW
jgi:hypothetical protein